MKDMDIRLRRRVHASRIHWRAPAHRSTTAARNAASVFSSNLSAARLDLRHAGADATKRAWDDAETTRLWLAALLAAGVVDSGARRAADEAALPQLRSAAIALIDDAGVYERASTRE